METSPPPLEARVESEAFAADEMQVYSLRGREAISQPFAFDIDVVLPESAGPFDVEDAILSDASLVLHREGAIVRQAHGIIASVDQRYDGDETLGRRYTLHLVPHLHALSLVTLQDLTLGKSVPDLIADKLQKHGFESADFSMGALSAKYPTRELIVQFAESDLAFISRLAEHLGIAYLFDHRDGRDQLVFCDNKAGFGEPDEGSTLHLRPRGEQDSLFELSAKRTAIPAVYAVMDYNYRKPELDLTSQFESELGDMGGVVEWGSHHKDPDEAEAMARIRAEEHECRRSIFEGKSSHVHVSAGFRYAVKGHPDLDDQTLLVTEVEHEASFATLTGHGQQTTKGYANRFKAIPGEQSYRPPRITPKPRIPGLIHGIVEPRDLDVVEANPRIDEAGRYWIKFLFDDAPRGERQASHPVRRAQPTVGAGYGMHFPLRPGIEVVMGFINGDPDRPIVLGAVHNARTPNVVEHKTSLSNVVKTVSGVKMTFKDPALKDN